jgi:hypothetical protein
MLSHMGCSEPAAFDGHEGQGSAGPYPENMCAAQRHWYQQPFGPQGVRQRFELVINRNGVSANLLYGFEQFKALGHFW